MYVYEGGDLTFTTDRDRARRLHAVTMAASGHYPLAPEAVGALHELLGPAPIGQGRKEAALRLRRVLSVLGLGDLTVTDVVEHLDRDWKLVLNAV